MKEILKYIKLYTGCNDHALKRIEAILEPKLNQAPIIIETIVKPKKTAYRQLPSKTPIKEWAEKYYKDFGVTKEQIFNRSRRLDVVEKRDEFIKSAYMDGYKCTAIARYLERNHTTILNALSK